MRKYKYLKDLSFPISSNTPCRDNSMLRLFPSRCLLLSRSFSTLPLSSITTTLNHQQEITGDPYELIHDDPVEILTTLWTRSFSRSTTSPPFPNLTGYLSNFHLWLLSYQRASAHFTGSFPPLHAIHRPQLLSLLSLRNHTLSHPSNHPWGSSSNSNLLLLHSPIQTIEKKQVDLNSFTFQDRVVQELLLLLIEPVVESRFSRRSHAFRPGRSPHTVIRTIRSNFASFLWFVKVDLSAVSGNLSGDLIVSCLQKFIGDKKVVAIVKSALRSRKEGSACQVLDKLKQKRLKRKVLRLKKKKKVLKQNEPKPDPYWLRTFYGFAPEEAAKVPDYGHCGIISPILANVCLHELDAWMEERVARYSMASKIDDGCHNPAWPEFVPSSGGNEKSRQMDFVRYGSHILVGIRGPREDAVEFRKGIVDFCESVYGIRLGISSVEIEHISRGIEFLDHIISRRVIHPTLRYTSTGGQIVSEKGIGTLLSVTANMQRCITQFRQLELVKGDRDPEPLPCNPMLYAGQAHTNSQMNKFLETMADWYKYADNRKKIVGFCAYVIRSSLAKLYAARYRLKSRAKVYKLATRDLSHPLRESTRNEAPEYSDLLRIGLVDAIEGVQFSHMSSIPSCDYTPFPRNWKPDHEHVLHEYIKLQDPKLFYELYKSVKRQGLSSPQNDIAKVVWDYKVYGVLREKCSESVVRSSHMPSEGRNLC